MVVSYDGTAYCGFQIQPRDHTVQQELERAIYVLTGERVKVISSGRTDAGVHAKAQVINFLTECIIPIDRWCFAVNTRLPRDIVVHKASEAPLNFHSRHHAKRKTYRYTIQRSKIPDVFYRHTRFHHPTRLDLSEMQNGLSHLVGEHDFSAFCSARTPVGSHVRTIYEATMEFIAEPSSGDGQAGVIHIYITGNGFLYNMVRIIVGTLLQIGQGKRSGVEMNQILLSGDRNKAGPTAMAHGLTLWEVSY
ncbi:tRNA pseudouridine(38-40) synthase TruA [Paenibacillus psychroresistens]|uniref:tRNA pseudouridine synthase A n=2 Tax=Paenibacillus psychroresistens TaxID=1778678 RepID=A0A6B8RVF2_9BACL|nr:tRNA pseudouridine(38-40) synthase TruA [Paenibacillus psychroresistens]